MHNHRELKIWQSSMALAKDVLLLTKCFPQHELYSLTSQINRAVISIPSNIAEGSSRASNKEFCHYLSISLGSCFELSTQLTLAESLAYIPKNQFEEFNIKTNELEKMIASFIRTLRNQQ